MNQVSPYWNERVVLAYLEEAAAIHRRLPSAGPSGFHSLWPETMKDDWHRLYDLLHGKTRLGAPMPPEVTFQEQVMEWLRILPRDQQQLVWMRANNVPWKILVHEYGRSKPTLWREQKRSLARIAATLNSIDREGRFHRHLRARAGGIVTP